ncbi:MAG: arsenate reductase ArsC [Candidatus Lokiarchaeota archaeon]|nr:arsenate reductase ArsC [Candidatus Lokiarchaeota archaeon]
MIKKKKVLFLCTENSCRSQMAEGLLRYFGGDYFEIFSAGIEPASEVNPFAVEVMKEIGIDISRQYPKHIKEFLNQNIDYVITTCDNAQRSCPIFPGNTINIHWRLNDPAEAVGTKEERLKVFRNTRDLIYKKIQEFLKLIVPH